MESAIKAQREALDAAQDMVGVLQRGVERVVKARGDALEVVQDMVGVL